MENKQLKVSAVIVTYNRLELLKGSIEAVLNQEGSNLNHLIIINNLSTDGTKEYLENLTDERIIVVTPDKNIGGAGGFNLGIKTFYYQTDDDLVWLMDDDTYPTKNALSEMTDFYDEYKEELKIGFLSSNVRWGKEEGLPSWMNVTAPVGHRWIEASGKKGNPIMVHNSTFVSVLIPRDIIARIGFPQKEYFIWGDDIEFTNRITMNHNGFVIPGSIVVHKSKKNDKPGDIIGEKDESRIPRYNYEFRNRLLTGRRLGKRRFIRSIIHNNIDLVRLFTHTKSKFKFRKSWIIVKGTFKGIFFNPDIELVENPGVEIEIANNRVIDKRKKEVDEESEG